ncbi:MAG: ATP-binding protein [Chloroflexaceae bacterium]|nr:ATP-binding protein [Chloroflexaceae bacterium]
MSHSTQIHISFPSVLGYEKVARDAVASFAKFVGFDSHRLEDIKTALGEACINAIEHGNLLNADLRVHVLCTYEHNRFLVKVFDQGLKDYNKATKPISIEEKVAGLGTLRGMGLMIITELADESAFFDESDGSSCLQLTWYCDLASKT